MLHVKTTIENGTATIYLYEDDRLINGLRRSFSTNEEAQAWLNTRGLRIANEFDIFMDYIATKGSLGQYVLDLLKKDSSFTLNGTLAGVVEREGYRYISNYCQVLDAYDNYC